MTRNPQKTVGVFAILLGVWVATYWLYQPAEPPITFGSAPEGFTEATPLAAVDSAPAARASVEPAQPRQVVQPPKFRRYTVQAGDNGWETIAKRVYGDRRYWEAVSRANPLVTPDRLKPGVTVLNIPLDPTNIQGRVLTIVPEPTPAPSPAPGPRTTQGPARAEAAPSENPAPAPEQTYVVQSGDTLSTIAKKVYGKSALWERLFEANRDRLSDPAKVRPGMTLRIPPQPAG